MDHYFNFSLYKERNCIKKAKISLKTTLQIELHIEYEDLLAYHNKAEQGSATQVPIRSTSMRQEFIY